MLDTCIQKGLTTINDKPGVLVKRYCVELGMQKYLFVPVMLRALYQVLKYLFPDTLAPVISADGHPADLSVTRKPARANCRTSHRVDREHVQTTGIDIIPLQFLRHMLLFDKHFPANCRQLLVILRPVCVPDYKLDDKLIHSRQPVRNRYAPG